jgi:hypothetical protein
MLSTPARIAEGSKIRTITGRRGGSGIGIGFFVVVVWEVIECLKSVAGILVK